MPTKQLRYRKIGETVEPRRTIRECHVPVLHIQGKWLEQAGFRSGTKVRIKIDQDVLIITKEAYEI